MWCWLISDEEVGGGQAVDEALKTTLEDDNMRRETEYKLPDFPELNFITRSIVTQVGTRAHTRLHMSWNF